ncbi:MAG: ADP-ribosylglycohydrolase family protein [Bacteroidales bacterium]|nr:ADP-ribosylglycohydrolase family protein [Bacteroidales bacterium]
MYRNRMTHPNIASDRINKLEDDEVFVFGSNLAGHHAGGAARIANESFGAVWGIGVGPTGRAYAIPTMHGGVDDIKPYVDQFIEYADKNRHYKFLVTRIGCGIAGFTDEEIAPLFKGCLNMGNVFLPQSFHNIITKSQSANNVMTPSLMGAIIGDMVGSIYEFNPIKTKDFPLMSQGMDYTDDTIMTIAVADWLMHDEAHSKETLVDTMRKWGQKYPNPMGAYGGSFSSWLTSKDPQPYNSWGNGSAMRVSAVGYWSESLEECLELAKTTAEVTHNHPEGIKGAQATAAAIFLARNGHTLKDIKEYIESTFGYDLSRTCDEIRKTYHFDPSCQGTVPESIIAVLESTDYEDAIRTVVSLGGDADTMGAITGAIAYAQYKGISRELDQFAKDKLPEDILDIVFEFGYR